MNSNEKANRRRLKEIGKASSAACGVIIAAAARQAGLKPADLTARNSSVPVKAIRDAEALAIFCCTERDLPIRAIARALNRAPYSIRNTQKRQEPIDLKAAGEILKAVKK